MFKSGVKLRRDAGRAQPSGKHGCAAGTSPGSGCPTLGRSRIRRDASRRPRYCRASGRAAADPHPSTVRGGRRVPLSREGKDRAQESYACQQTPPPEQDAPAMGTVAPPAASPDYRAGPAPRTRCSTSACTSCSGRRPPCISLATSTGATSSTRRHSPISRLRHLLPAPAKWQADPSERCSGRRLAGAG